MLLLLSFQTIGIIWLCIIILIACFALYCNHRVEKNTRKRAPISNTLAYNKYSGWLESRAFNQLKTQLKNQRKNPPSWGDQFKKQTTKEKLKYILQFAQHDSVDLYHCLKQLELPPNHPMLMDQRATTENINTMLHFVDNNHQDYSGNKDLINLTYYLYLQKFTKVINDPFRPNLNYAKICRILIYSDLQIDEHENTLAQHITQRYLKIIRMQGEEDTLTMDENIDKEDLFRELNEDEFGLEGTI